MDTYEREVNGEGSVDFELSMTFPFNNQCEPWTGRVVSVRLQRSTAEVWLKTSKGSAMMFGPVDRKQNNQPLCEICLHAFFVVHRCQRLGRTKLNSC